ncbi:hypothetical protein BpHYR1_031323 [Brachionus plicatilis]|uniref:Uncharacterized protein n=1 Tax=Brachionus plicatilis TaxID=10195 RepID=A0A3M7QRI1_BRAPC|nr:hypothetical protein BpHYR1_031323 [Brachionus plicatilis]
MAKTRVIFSLELEDKISEKFLTNLKNFMSFSNAMELPPQTSTTTFLNLFFPKYLSMLYATTNEAPQLGSTKYLTQPVWISPSIMPKIKPPPPTEQTIQSGIRFSINFYHPMRTQPDLYFFPDGRLMNLSAITRDFLTMEFLYEVFVYDLFVQFIKLN